MAAWGDLRGASETPQRVREHWDDSDPTQEGEGSGSGDVEWLSWVVPSDANHNEC